MLLELIHCSALSFMSYFCTYDCEIIILMFKRRFFVYCWFFFCLLSCYSSVLLERSQNPDYKKRKPFFSSLSNQSLPSKILCGNTVNGCSHYGGSQWFVNFHLYLDLCHQFLFIFIFLGDAVSKWFWLRGKDTAVHIMR